VPAPNCGGILAGIADNGGDVTNCSWLDFAQPSGKVTRTVPITICQDRGSSSNGTAQSIFSFDEHAYFFVTGSGRYVWWVDDSTVEIKQWAEFPASYGFTVGIQAIADQGLYILTTSALYYVPSQGVFHTILDVSSWGLNATALFGSNFWDAYLHITQGNKIWTIDVTGSTPKVSTVTGTLSAITDLVVYLSYVDNAPAPTLLVMQDYSLYLVDTSSGASKVLMPVPKGPGNPRVNAYGPDTFFYCDSASIYSIDVPNAKLVSSTNFALCPTLQGNFQWHP